MRWARASDDADHRHATFRDDRSQTLSRGLTALSLLADHGRQSIQSLADLLGVHRSVAYRLVVRDSGGMLSLGPQLVILARDVEHDSQQLAAELGMTAFLAVRDGDDAVTLVTAVPRGVNASVAQHPGHRHPIALGAPGVALQSMLDEATGRALGHDEPMHPESESVRTRGYAVSANEVIQGITSVGAPIVSRGTTDASAGLVTDGGVRDLDAVTEISVPTYHAGGHPAVLRRPDVPWSLDETIACGGATMQPGDIIVGDDDGVLVIPPALVRELVEESLAQDAEEEWIARQVDAAHPVDGLFPMNAQWRAKYEAETSVTAAS